MSKAPNNVYFTRICLAKYLRDKGFPFDVKVSLLTRDRAEAFFTQIMTCNIDVAGALKKIIKSINHQTRINDFIRYVDEVINHLRAQFDAADADFRSTSRKNLMLSPLETLSCLSIVKPPLWRKQSLLLG